MTVTLRQASEDWLRLSTGRYAASTRDSHKIVMRRFVRTVGDIQMNRLTQGHVENFFYDTEHGLANKVKPSTCNHYRAILVAFFRFSLNRGWLRTDPLANIPPFKVEQVERVRLTVEQMVRALDVCRHPRDRVFIALAMNTGMRVSELLSLKIGDVSLDKGEIVVSITKTGKHDNFPITADLDGELRTWLVFYAEHCGTLQPDWYLVPSKQALTPGGYATVNGDPLAVDLYPLKRMAYPRHLLEYVFTELGVRRPGMGAHTFRRSVARAYYDHMLNQTDSKDDALRITQSLLNHSSSQMTEKYIGVERERNARDVSLRGKSFLPKPDANVVRLHRVN